MSELNAPWSWNHVMEDEDDCELWLPLKDGDGNVIASYASCGSHQIELAPRHAAIIEAAAEMFDYTLGQAIEGDGKAQRIMNAIMTRQTEFSA